MIKSYAESGVQRLVCYDGEARSSRSRAMPTGGQRTGRGPIMKPQNDLCEVSSTRIERVRIIGRVNERSECYAWLDENGIENKRSGPYTFSEMHPDYDKQHFLIESDKREGEAMDSQARDFMILGIQLKGLNIKL